MKTLKALLTLVTCLVLAAIFTGCAGVSQINGQIVSVDSACLGLDLSQSQTDPAPHFRFGLIRNSYSVIPIQKNTNATSTASIAAPNFKSGFRAQHKLWSLDANNQLAAGETNVVISANFDQNTNVFNTGTSAVK